MHGNRRPIYGVGVNDWPTKVYSNNKPMKEYQVWTGILSRCFNEKEKARKPSYRDAVCSDDWLTFSNFRRDLIGMTGYGLMVRAGWEIDKDLLVKGNKLYSKETCCLIPKELNLFLIKGRGSRGELPIGVHERASENLSKKFVSTLFFKGKHIHLGYFSSEIDAHLAYKKKKEEMLMGYARELDGIADKSVIDALNNYSVEIDD